jgi:hypothetical protein
VNIGFQPLGFSPSRYSLLALHLFPLCFLLPINEEEPNHSIIKQEGSSQARYFVSRLIPAHKDPPYEQVRVKTGVNMANFFLFTLV